MESTTMSEPADAADVLTITEEEKEALRAKIAQYKSDLPNLLSANDHMSASCCLGMTANDLLSLGLKTEALDAQRKAVEQTKLLNVEEHPDRDALVTKRLEWIAEKTYHRSEPGETNKNTEEEKADVRRIFAEAAMLVPDPAEAEEVNNSGAVLLAKTRLDYFYDVVACTLLGPDAYLFFSEQTSPGGALEQSNTLEAWCELGDSLRSAARERIDCRKPAMECYRIAAERGDEAGDPRARFADTSRGLMCIEAAEYDEAIQVHGKCADAAREKGDHEGLVTCLGNLGYAHASKGEYDAAINIYHEALGHAAEHCASNPSCAHGALHNLGASLQLTGRTAEAAEVQKAAEMILIETRCGDLEEDEERKRAGGAALANKAALLLQLGRHDESIEAYQKAIELAKEIGDKLYEAKRIGGMGCAHRCKGEKSKARELLEDAVKRLEGMEDYRDARLFAGELKLVQEAEAEGKGEGESNDE